MVVVDWRRDEFSCTVCKTRGMRIRLNPITNKWWRYSALKNIICMNQTTRAFVNMSGLLCFSAFVYALSVRERGRNADEFFLFWQIMTLHILNLNEKGDFSPTNKFLPPPLHYIVQVPEKGHCQVFPSEQRSAIKTCKHRARRIQAFVCWCSHQWFICCF